jgi:transketolase
MRTAFIEELAVQARSDDRIFLIVGDLGFSVVEPFAREFPDRFLNVGVAEQNMTGVAAGLASEGYHVFTYSIANFPTIRCLEQIRNDVAYHRLPVTIVAVGGGLAYGNLGYSHHAVQDYAVMRPLPGMIIAAPGDPLETRACVEWLCRNPGPSYLRLGKAGETVYHRERPQIECGKLVRVRDAPPENGIFLTTGAALGSAVQAHERQRPPNLCGVYSMPIWGEPVKQFVATALRAYQSIVAAEDHLAAGGFSSFLRETLGSDGIMQSRLHTISLDEAVCGMVAGQAALNALGGLTPEQMIDAATGLRGQQERS